MAKPGEAVASTTRSWPPPAVPAASGAALTQPGQPAPPLRHPAPEPAHALVALFPSRSVGPLPPPPPRPCCLCPGRRSPSAHLTHFPSLRCSSADRRPTQGPGHSAHRRTSCREGGGGGKLCVDGRADRGGVNAGPLPPSTPVPTARRPSAEPDERLPLRRPRLVTHPDEHRPPRAGNTGEAEGDRRGSEGKA